MRTADTALEPARFIRSVEASCDSLGKVRLKLLDVVAHVRTLTDDAPYAVLGGLAQILWARKTHTDDLDVALATSQLDAALDAIRESRAPPGWELPTPPDRAREVDDVFEVCHLLYEGSVVDLITFADASFNDEILRSARTIPELGSLRFIKPELLLVTHLLRPGATGALAAVELILARRQTGGFDEPLVRTWAQKLGRESRLERVLESAAALERT